MFEFGTAGLGLLAGLVWGAGDFSGGLASRSSNVLSVTLVSNAVGVVLALLYANVVAAPAPNQHDVFLSIIAGAAGLVGILSFYRALATTKMGLVAPVSALVANVVSVLFSVLKEGSPSFWQLIGFALASLGVWWIGVSATAQENGNTKKMVWSRGLWLAVLSGVGFGGFFIFFGQLDASASTTWPLVALRSTSFLLIVLVLVLRREKVELSPASRLPALLAGLFDTSGNALFAIAAQSARLDVAAVLSSLYPASTVLLAFLLLHEKLSKQQQWGVTLCLFALPLIVS